MEKRIKSFFIVFGSVLLTAFLSFIPTIEFANLVEWIGAVVQTMGVPSVVWAAIVGFITQAWFAWRNSVNAKKEGFSSVTSAKSRGEGVDFY